MPEAQEGSEPVPQQLLEVIENLSKFHREHERFYSQAPLGQAHEIQRFSRVLKALAAHWSKVEPSDHGVSSPFAGAEDLNPPGLVAESGFLFMEEGGEPAEIGQMKRELTTRAGDMETIGGWLANAMEQSWAVAGALAKYPQLADVLGERHRIIANDWLSADMQLMIGRLLRRANDLLEEIDFRVEAVRADLAERRSYWPLLYSASELLDRASDLMAESATLVHDNDRRWRVFGDRVAQLLARAG
jgi:hypothetical protein